jgi:hypothetical protein
MFLEAVCSEPYRCNKGEAGEEEEEESLIEDHNLQANSLSSDGMQGAHCGGGRDDPVSAPALRRSPRSGSHGPQTFQSGADLDRRRGGGKWELDLVLNPKFAVCT